MSIVNEIESRIRSSINAHIIITEDKSSAHKGHAGLLGTEGEVTHIKLLVVSNSFQGKSPLDRERAIFTLLKKEIKSLHSISFTLHTVEEYERKNRQKNRQKDKRRESVAYGIRAEQLSRQFLEDRGYVTITTRYKTRHGEIDIVAEKDGYIMFVEVKGRSKISDNPSEEEFVITHKQVQRNTKAALEFLSSHPSYAQYQVRFDVVLLRGDVVIKHIQNSWQCNMDYEAEY